MSTSAEPGAAAALRPRWTRRRTLGILALLAFALLLRAMLPEALRWGAERAARDALGRQVAIADVDLGLLAGRVEIEGLEIGGEIARPLDRDALLARCASARVRIAWLPLLGGHIRLREITLVEPMLRLARAADGSLAPFVLAASEPAAEPPAEPAAAESASALDLGIEQFALDRAELSLVRQRDAAPIAELRFENFSVGDFSLHEGVIGIGAVALRGPDLKVNSDNLAADAEAAASAPAASPDASAADAQQGGASLRVSDLDIEAARFTWRMPDGEAIEAEIELHARDAGLSGDAFPLELRLATDGASLALEGRLGLGPLRFDGELRWQGLGLARLARAVPSAPVAVSSGLSDGELELALNTAPADPQTPAAVHAQGRARVTDLGIASPDAAWSVAWKSLAVEIGGLELPLGEGATSPEVRLAKLALDEPKVDVVRSAPTPAPPAAEPAGAAAPAEGAPEPAPAASTPRVVLDVLEVNRGSLRVLDRSVQPPVDTKLRDLRVRARAIRWPERDLGSLRLTARGPQAASLELKGSFARGVGSLDLDLRELPLTPFDPYAGQATGLELAAGRASVAGTLGLRKDGFAAKSKLSLHQLSMSERESGWFQKSFGVPLDVALALLRDLRGDISLPIDVEQSTGGTRVGLAAAVTSALRQALTGALASPLKLLGGVAGAASGALSSGLAPIPMEPGRADLAASAHERVASLAKLLASRPGLQVALKGSAGPQDDPELARREIVALAKAGEALPGEGELGFFERRRVRSALADADVEDLAALDAESAAALARLAGSVQVSEASRQALAVARAQAVARALEQDHGGPADAVAAMEGGSGPAQVALELRSR